MTQIWKAFATVAIAMPEQWIQWIMFLCFPGMNKLVMLVIRISLFSQETSSYNAD